MIWFNIEELNFHLNVVEEEGELDFNVTCDSYIDDELECDMTLYDRAVVIHHDVWDFDVDVDINVKSEDSCQNVTVTVNNREQILEELNDLKEMF